MREVLYFYFTLFAINATWCTSYTLFNIPGEKKASFNLTEHIQKPLQKTIPKADIVDERSRSTIFKPKQQGTFHIPGLL